MTQKDEVRSQASGELVGRVAERLASWGISYVPQRSDDPIYDRLAERVVDDVVTPELERRDADLALAEERIAKTRQALRLDEKWSVQHGALAVRSERDRAVAERDALRAQLDRAVLVWPQDAMVRIRECIADPSRMGVREEETVAAWGARAVIKLMESWRARVSESVPATPDELRGNDADEESLLSLLAELPPVRIRFWTCPVHREQRDEDGYRNAIVEWREGIAYCMVDGCDRTSAPAAASADTTPRVWTFGDAYEPRDVGRLQDAEGDLWERRDTGKWHCLHDATWPPYYFQRLVHDFGPLVEVLPSAEQEAEK